MHKGDGRSSAHQKVTAKWDSTLQHALLQGEMVGFCIYGRAEVVLNALSTIFTSLSCSLVVDCRMCRLLCNCFVANNVLFIVHRIFHGFAKWNHRCVCGPVFIHTDKSARKKEKEMLERENQRKGEIPTPIAVSPRFKEGFHDLPEAAVFTTFSGSMVQEVLYEYTQHCIRSLEKERGDLPCDPVIHFLDGHSSRWSVPAL